MYENPELLLVMIFLVLAGFHWVCSKSSLLYRLCETISIIGAVGGFAVIVVPGIGIAAITEYYRLTHWLPWSQARQLADQLMPWYGSVVLYGILSIFTGHFIYWFLPISPWRQRA